MTLPAEGDLARLTAPAESLFKAAVIPAGTDGTVLAAWPDGACLAELALRPQAADQDGGFAPAVLTGGQYEVRAPAPRTAAGPAGSSCLSPASSCCCWPRA